jgi:hypothetical protein
MAQPNLNTSEQQTEVTLSSWHDDDMLDPQEIEEMEGHIFRVFNPASPIHDRFKT